MVENIKLKLRLHKILSTGEVELLLPRNKDIDYFVYLPSNSIIMSIYYIDGSYTNITDYDVLIESEYYNNDYDDINWEEPIDNEIKPQTESDILFE